MKLSLVVTSGKPEGKEIPIRLSQFVIGRDPECHLRPASPLISKRHCALIVRDERAYLRDFNSTNGTFVNKQPLKGEIELKNGDEFGVGPLTFLVKLEAGVADTPVPATATPRTPAPAGQAQAGTRTTTGETRAPAPAKPQSASDDDLVMEMLLNLEGSSSTASGNDPIPPGSTIMQIIGAAAPQESEKKEEAKPDDKKEKKKISDPQATSNAAKAILDKYMRRPRA